MTRRRPYPVTGTYSGEEISATFTAMMIPDSDGHAGLPNGIREFYSLDPGSIEVERVDILGKTVGYKTLPDVVRDLIFGLNTEVDWK